MPVSLLVLTRMADIYSTSLWILRPDGLQDESNPLSHLPGIGWEGLLIINVLLTIGIILLYAYACFHWCPSLTLTGEAAPDSVWAYASRLYFGETGQLAKILYRWPANKRAMVAHTGILLTHATIAAGLLALVHNLGQYHAWAWYASFREMVVRPHFVIYGLVMLVALATW